jgi:hypothetical protein
MRKKALRAFASRGDRAELVGEAPLGDSEERHSNQTRGGEADAEPTRGGMLGGDEVVDRLGGDVGGKKEELDRDQFLRALLDVTPP